MIYLILIAGFILLIKGADAFVDGSSSLAKILKIPSVIIGLTIVAMGTSAPEAAVSITAGLAGENDIALSNIIGSNIFNLLVVVGICALLRTVPSNKDIVKRDLPFNIAITVLMLILMINGEISRLEGLVLIIVMIVYLYLMIRSALNNRVTMEEDTKILSPVISMVYIVLGLAAIVLGGKFVVDSASAIAVTLGMSQTLVGLTIVAIGTSLPELVTSVVAAKKGENGLALGNVVGSNIFNILFILGMSSALSPIAVAGESIIDGIILLAVTVLAYIFCRSKMTTSKKEGAIFLVLYAVYLGYVILR